VDYKSVKVKLVQSWRCKTLAVIKRHKTTSSLSLNKIHNAIRKKRTFLTSYFIWLL